MSAKTAKLKTQAREKLGSRASRKLRAAGQIPASLHGASRPPTHFSIDEYEFLTARRHHDHVFEMEGDASGEAAVVRELQYDAFGDRIVHVEFMRVVLGQKMESEVELNFTGRPKSGVLNHLVTHVTISSVPTAIPDYLEIKIEGLESGAHLSAADAILPEGVSLVTPLETPIAVISEPQGEDEEAEGDEAAEAEGAAPDAGASPEAPAS